MPDCLVRSRQSFAMCRSLREEVMVTGSLTGNTTLVDDPSVPPSIKAAHESQRSLVSMGSPATRILSCGDCGQGFAWSESDQEEYARRGHRNLPRRCPACRARRRAEREVEGRDG